jgi:hypothetical protein
MNNRLLRHFILIFLAEIFLSGSSLNGQLNLIIYTDFINPKSTYDSLRKDIMLTGLADSITITGMPIMVPAIYIQIDTTKANLLGIAPDDIYDKIEKSDKDNNFINELQKMYIKNKSGQMIPIANIISIHYSLDYYMPEVFKPSPDTFCYQGIRAVKVELYCQKRNEKKLGEYIKGHIDDYADGFNYI